ncbi:MAG TPA: hypothetical protein VFI65_11655 [Streptosporangiaceae bacterium]|nr:hypothetical protein [Streptosporangiaceae bacterium]
MTYQPPNPDPTDGPAASSWGQYQPPGQRDDLVELGGLGRAGGGGMRRAVIGAAVAVVGLLGGAGVAYAAAGGGSGATLTSAGASPSASPSASAPTPPTIHCRISMNGSTKTPKNCPPFGRFPGRHFGFPGGFPGGIAFPFGVGGALHGQFVVAKSGGGYQTVDVQRGKVTAVSSTSLTVKSTDGFTATYAVSSSTIVDAQRDGIGSVKSGNQVYVSATVSGSRATATSIFDLTLIGQGKGGPFGFGWPPGIPSSNQNSNPAVN